MATIMTLDQYLNQTAPEYMPIVQLKPDEYKVVVFGYKNSLRVING